MSAANFITKQTYGPELGLRPGTMLRRWVINFIFNDGGMGDFINYSAATVWLAKNAPWIKGRIFVPRYLEKLMEDIHKGCDDWRVYPSEDAKQYLESGTAILGPGIIMNGQKTMQQLVTCLGTHPFDLGFGYYAHTCPAPDGAMLPMLDYGTNMLPRDWTLEPGSYVVLPVGNVSPARMVTGKHINPLIDDVIRRGLMPVFIGKRDRLLDGTTDTAFAEDINYDRGLDLRDKTTVQEAAAVMQYAAATVGLDTGPLHLAAIMKDSRLVFGYNITTVEHRKPRRNWGKTVDVALTPGELECSGCQSRLKNVHGHKFDRCLYGDNKCVDLLFADGAARFRQALDEVLT